MTDAEARIAEPCKHVVEMLTEALEFVACEGMDDGDFYAEEWITEGTIAMANRARSALAAARAHRCNHVSRTEGGGI